MTTDVMYRLQPPPGASTAVLGSGVRLIERSLDDALIVFASTADEPEAYRRAASLRVLARWSIEQADLDWDHLDQIDQTGWGAVA